MGVSEGGTGATGDALPGRPGGREHALRARFAPRRDGARAEGPRSDMPQNWPRSSLAGPAGDLPVRRRASRRLAGEDDGPRAGPRRPRRGPCLALAAAEPAGARGSRPAGAGPGHPCRQRRHLPGAPRVHAVPRRLGRPERARPRRPPHARRGPLRTGRAARAGSGHGRPPVPSAPRGDDPRGRRTGSARDVAGAAERKAPSGRLFRPPRPARSGWPTCVPTGEGWLSRPAPIDMRTRKGVGRAMRETGRMRASRSRRLAHGHPAPAPGPPPGSRRPMRGPRASPGPCGGRHHALDASARRPAGPHPGRRADGERPTHPRGRARPYPRPRRPRRGARAPVRKQRGLLRPDVPAFGPRLRITGRHGAHGCPNPSTGGWINQLSARSYLRKPGKIGPNRRPAQKGYPCNAFDIPITKLAT